jgi:hypothetical protein
VAFQIVQTAETRLTSRALVWFFLAVRQQMAFEVVVSRKVGGAVGAFVTLCRRRFGCVLAIAWQTHLASRGTRIRLWWQRAGKRESAVAGIIAQVWRDELVMVLLVLLVL